MIIPHLSLVKTINKETLYTESKIRQFIINADEPVNNKGTDLAPTPFDLLNSSLASCTAIYLRLFAAKNNFEIGEIKIKLQIKKMESGGFVFIRTLYFENLLNESKISLLLKAAENTPVTKIIGLSNTIQTTINHQSSI